MIDAKTCGEYYREALHQYGKSEPEYWAFAAGFVSGQAEKVFIGSCKAAMFRPSEANIVCVSEIVRDVCQRYGIAFRRWNDELWIFRPGEGVSDELAHLQGEERDSPRYHAIRADLCGVSLRNFDAEFHLRQGYGKDCD